MPQITLKSAGQLTSLQEVVDFVERLRKTLSWLLMNLDTLNVKELSADVINTGTLNADLVKIESATSRITLDTTGIKITFANGGNVLINKDGLLATFVDGATFKIDSTGVTVDRGHYFLQTTERGKEIIGEGYNLIRDHSFEAILPLGNADTEMSYVINTTFMGNAFWWNIVGAPRVRRTIGTDSPPFSLFGFQSLLVNDVNYVWQQAWVRKEKPRGPYNLSVYAAPRGNNTLGVPISCTLTIRALDPTNVVLGSVTKTFTITPAYSSSDVARYKRGSVTYDVLPVGTERLEVEIRSSDSEWIEIDGVALVPFNQPTIYMSEDSFWAHLHNLDGTFHRNLNVFGEISMGTEVGEGPTLLHPYHSTSRRVWIGNNEGFEVRDYNGLEAAFSVSTVAKGVYTPWLALNGAIDTPASADGAFRFRSSSGRFQGYVGGLWKDLAYVADLSSYVTSAQLNSILANYATHADVDNAIAAHRWDCLSYVPRT